MVYSYRDGKERLNSVCSAYQKHFTQRADAGASLKNPWKEPEEEPTPAASVMKSKKRILQRRVAAPQVLTGAGFPFAPLEAEGVF